MIGGDEEAVKRNTGLMRPNDKRRWITLYCTIKFGEIARIWSPFSPVHSEPAKTLIVAKGQWSYNIAVSPLLLWDKSRLVALPTFSTPNMA